MLQKLRLGLFYLGNRRVDIAMHDNRIPVVVVVVVGHWLLLLWELLAE